MKTEQKILAKALEQFNERGIEYVGLRELAALLNMRVSNITYYFPTKDDLVNALSLELQQHNSAVLVPHEHLTMRQFLEMLHRVFQNHVKFRCLLLSVVHLMEQNKVMKERYKDTQRLRNASLATNIQALANSGYLQLRQESDKEYLVSALSLISRFWISEAAISYRALSTEEQIQHYLQLIVKLLEPYATEQGREEMDGFVAGDE